MSKSYLSSQLVISRVLFSLGLGIFLILAVFTFAKANSGDLSLDNLLLLAQESIAVGNGSVVHSGNIANNAPDSNPKKYGIKIGKSVRISPEAEESIVVGFDVAVGDGSALDRVISDLLKQGKKVEIAEKTSPVAGVLPIELPKLSSACESVQGNDLIIAKNEVATVNPGAYNSVKIGKSAKVKFSEGIYDANTFSMSHGSIAYFEGPTTIRVRDGYVRMPSGGAFNPDNIHPVVIEYCGVKSVTSEKSLNACVLAPNGTIALKGQSEVFKGQFIAKNITVGKNNSLFLDSCFGEEPLPPSDLEVVCGAAPRAVEIDEEVVWTADPAGGTGDYEYSWTGDATGTSQVIKTSYSTPGWKTATVTVSSGDQSVDATCKVKVRRDYFPCDDPCEPYCDSCDDCSGDGWWHWPDNGCDGSDWWNWPNNGCNNDCGSLNCPSDNSRE